jgi:succinate dehydrogenase/fumarate reductase flavoprotein subunit
LLDRGASVLLLDKQGFMGGNSTKATSGINGAGTAAQSDLGITDSAKTFFDDTKASAKDLARDDLIKVLTGKSADAVHWLMEKFELDLSKVSRLGGHSQPRTHRGGAQFPGMVGLSSPFSVWGSHCWPFSLILLFQTITYAQMEALEDLAVSMSDRVTIKKKARVTKLVKEDGKVVGVEYLFEGKTHTELGPVILATGASLLLSSETRPLGNWLCLERFPGGYAADFSESSLLKKHRPDIYELPTTNGDHCTGDGQKLAMEIGGSAIDLEKVQGAFSDRPLPLRREKKNWPSTLFVLSAVHPTGLVDPRDPDAKVKFLAAEGAFQ